APSHGKAALVYDPRSKGAESYIRLAKEIIERQVGYGSQPSPVSNEAAAGPEAAASTETAAPAEQTNVEEIPAAEKMDKTA
ncbi:MAG: ParA family protein, partial [Candidatus Sulfotelmatobacter sp.]